MAKEKFSNLVIKSKYQNNYHNFLIITWRNGGLLNMLKSPKKWSWLALLVCGLVFLLFNKQIQVKLCRKILLTIGNNIKRNIIIIGSTSFIQSLRYIEPLFSNSIPLNRTLLFHPIPYLRNIIILKIKKGTAMCWILLHWNFLNMNGL